MEIHHAWNKFVKEQKAKLKGSEVVDIHKLSDKWKAMPEEEKEKYGQKHLGPKNVIHCSASEFVKLLERGEKKRRKRKKQKAIDEEAMASSLNLKYKEFEEQFKFFEKNYPQGLCDGAEAVELVEADQNEDTTLVGPFEWADWWLLAPTTDPVSPETSQIDAVVNLGLEDKDDLVSSQKPDAGSSLKVYTRKKQKVKGHKKPQPGFTLRDAAVNQGIENEAIKNKDPLLKLLTHTTEVSVKTRLGSKRNKDGEIIRTGYTRDGRETVCDLLDVEPWTDEQCMGDTVFIPAGCSQQVRNLKTDIETLMCAKDIPMNGEEFGTYEAVNGYARERDVAGAEGKDCGWLNE